jgi:hypothetical protein
MLQRARLVLVHAAATTATVSLLLSLTACDTIGSDFQSMGDVLMPPSPQEAAQWAVDTTDPENMRRGITLLGNSTFGGVDAYVKLYRFYAEDMRDPLVQAAAIQALGRFGRVEDASLLAKRLDSPFIPVRLASAIALQRIHSGAVVEAMWRKLLDENEDPEVRIELAIGLGQYAQDDVFQALATSLDQSELAVNLASLDSLRAITGNDLGLSRIRWLSWYGATPVAKRFLAHSAYLYPTYQRHLGFWDYLVFWAIPKWDSPGLPVGIAGTGARDTHEAAAPPDATDPPKVPPPPGS